MTKDKVKVIEVEDVADMPVHYILFPDDLEAALIRLDELSEKLQKRGLKIAEPRVAFRRTVKENVYHKGKERVVKPRKPYSELAFRLEKI